MVEICSTFTNERAHDRFVPVKRAAHRFMEAKSVSADRKPGLTNPRYSSVCDRRDFLRTILRLDANGGQWWRTNRIENQMSYDTLFE